MRHGCLYLEMALSDGSLKWRYLPAMSTYYSPHMCLFVDPARPPILSGPLACGYPMP